MLGFLPAPLIGCIVLILLVANTVFWAVPVYVMILLKLLTPKGKARNAVSRLMAYFAQSWAMTDVLIYDGCIRTQWTLNGTELLNPSRKYLVVANHQSWNDIFVLMKGFGRRAPFFKFFIKQELIWVPILGVAWWGLDYPFMKRFSKAQLEKNPALKGKDLETTRRACAKYREMPVTVLNFLEGTRFTPEKHQRQHSPYKHLLKPRSGGFAFAMNVLGDTLDSILDVTIVYPGGAQGIWDLLCGRVRKVVFEVRELEVPEHLKRGDYSEDTQYRAAIHKWVADVWRHKDQRIAELQGR